MVLNEKSESEGVTGRMVLTVWYKKTNYQGNKKFCGCQRLEKQWQTAKIKVMFRANLQLFMMSWCWIDDVIAVFKLMEYTAQSMNPNVKKKRLWAITLYLCEFISYNKCTILAGYVDKGAHRACGWSRTEDIYIYI